MIAIDKVLVSDEVVEAHFVCDLHKCKGGCCEDGDAGAPLEREEMALIEKHYDVIRPYMAHEGIDEVKQQGKFVYDAEFGWVTPTINGSICAYGFRDKKGIIKCSIEAAYYDKKLEWKKPISCHLYPITINKTKEYTMVNYEPRDTLCAPACVLGKKVKMPVYQFLKDAIERRFGASFYEALDQVAIEHFDEGGGKK